MHNIISINNLTFSRSSTKQTDIQNKFFTGCRFRQWFISDCIRFSNPGANTAGLRATKHWPCIRKWKYIKTVRNAEIINIKLSHTVVTLLRLLKESDKTWLPRKQANTQWINDSHQLIWDCFLWPILMTNAMQLLAKNKQCWIIQNQTRTNSKLVNFVHYTCFILWQLANL